MKRKILGRQPEVDILERVGRSRDAEFVVLYGQRRVGKTHLIREFFSQGDYIYFEATGVKNAPMSTQLEKFTKGMSAVFSPKIPILTPKNWDQAFEILTNLIAKPHKSKKTVVFIDELPWLATKKSGLLQALDYYWNLHWSKLSHLILIICGSAASWMLENIVNAKGGLYNRLTKRIHLEPFNLLETKEFLESRSIKLNEKQILELYMAIGGIPYYLKEVEKGESAVQTIEKLCFQIQGPLVNEFENLYRALFDQAETNLSLIRLIAKSPGGVSRKELIEKSGIASGGTLNKRLNELIASGFIHCFVPYGQKTRDRYYRLIDEYSLFYLKWIEPLLQTGFSIHKGYWESMIQSGRVSAWVGNAFECICLKHTDQIRHALRIDRIPCKMGSWRFVPKKGSKEAGAQIDLLFDREDGAVTLCEIKYCDAPFVVDKNYAKVLANKIEVFERHTKANKQVFLALIASQGVKTTIGSDELIDSQVSLKELFS